MNDFVSAADFFKTVKKDERVYFLVRHGERNHIMPDDPDHGALVGLTDRGREQAFNLGRAVADNCRVVEKSGGLLQDVSFFSSPVGRCLQTAEYIGRGLGIASPDVVPLQPLAEFFVEHYDAYMETHTTGFYQGICRWLDGTASCPDYIDPAYFPLAKRSEEMLQFMLSHGNRCINIFCSHDAWIVPCLNHFCGMTFSPQVWMNFLTGIAFVVRADAPAKVDRIAAVTGLEDGNLFF